MIIKKFQYINLAQYIPTIIIIVTAAYLFHLYTSGSPSRIIIPVIVCFFLFPYLRLATNFLKYREVRRRMANLPIPKNYFYSWNYSGSIGASFIDPEKSFFWYCGSSTNFEIHIHPCKDFEIINYIDRIEYKNNSYIYTVFKYTEIIN